MASFVGRVKSEMNLQQDLQEFNVPQASDVAYSVKVVDNAGRTSATRDK
jgi:hypothetical protein